MLVRLKKRGSLNPHNRPSIESPRSTSLWLGKTIEVEPATYQLCDLSTFIVTDSRLVEPGTAHPICSHCLVDDLDAYDSDANDEEAGIGDIALADVRIPVEVKP